MSVIQQMLLGIERVIATIGTSFGTGGSNTLTLNKPTGTLVNHLMLMVGVGAFGGSGDWTGDTGWTEDYDRGNAGGFTVRHKVAGASEGSTYTFSQSNSNNYSGCIVTLKNAAFDVIGAANITSVPTMVAPEITVSQDRSWLIAAFSRDNATGTFTTPTGMTPLLSDVTDVIRPSWALFYEQVNSGLTGTRTSTVNGSNNNVAIMFSVKQV